MITSMILSVLLAATSSADSAASAEAAPLTQPKPPKPKKICKNVDLTGSRIGKRECKTQEQWDQSESAMELGQKGAKGTLAPPQMPTGI